MCIRYCEPCNTVKFKLLLRHVINSSLKDLHEKQCSVKLPATNIFHSFRCQMETRIIAGVFMQLHLKFRSLVLPKIMFI